MYENYRVYSRATSLIIISDTPISMIMNLTDWQGSLLIMARSSPRNSAVLFLSEILKFIKFIQLFFQILDPVQRLTLKHCKIFVLVLPVLIPVQRFVSQFQEKWIASWCSVPHNLYPTDSSLFYTRQNLKQIKCTREINNLKWRLFIYRKLYYPQGCFKLDFNVIIIRCSLDSLHRVGWSCWYLPNVNFSVSDTSTKVNCLISSSPTYNW